MSAFPKYLSITALALAACAGPQQEAHFRADQGWSLCRAPLPIAFEAYVPGLESTQTPADAWTEEQQTNIAGAVALAFALRCDDSEAVSAQAQGYRGITAINNPNANQVSVYPQPGSARLIVAVPAYADFRSDEFLADLRNGISCGLAPGEVADPDDCLAD